MIMDTFELRALRRALRDEHHADMVRARLPDLIASGQLRQRADGQVLVTAAAGWGWHDLADQEQCLCVARLVPIYPPAEDKIPFREILARPHHSCVHSAHRVALLGGRWGSASRTVSATLEGDQYRIVTEIEITYPDGTTEWRTDMPTTRYMAVTTADDVYRLDVQMADVWHFVTGEREVQMSGSHPLTKGSIYLPLPDHENRLGQR